MPLHPDHIGKTTFDGEGTPTRRTVLIEKGILQGFLHSSGTAKRLKAQLTASEVLACRHRLKGILLCRVLNALRHQRFWHLLSHFNER